MNCIDCGNFFAQDRGLADTQLCVHCGQPLCRRCFDEGEGFCYRDLPVRLAALSAFAEAFRAGRGQDVGASQAGTSPAFPAPLPLARGGLVS